MKEFENFISQHFGVESNIFLEALKNSPSANGYILGSISELVLKQHLESLDFEVLRIKEKPAGGNNAKNTEARGDFYIRKKDNPKDEWFVVESKGLKSNSEFRGSKLDNKDKLFRFLKPLAFPAKDQKQKIYDKGFKTYEKAKERWKKENPNKKFPTFAWELETAGANATDLSGIWKDETALKEWIDTQEEALFTEKAYREGQGIVKILETHQPSTRTAPKTEIKQASPLVADFNIMAVDLFLRTGTHEFAFMNAEKISHSPTSPEHLYQNYTIDILLKDLKTEIVFRPSWYNDIEKLITETNPKPRNLDKSQLDLRT